MGKLKDQLNIAIAAGPLNKRQRAAFRRLFTSLQLFAFFCEPMTQLIDSSFISSNDQSMTSRVATATNRNVVTKTSRVSMQSLCHSSRILDAMAHETNKQRKVTNQKIFQLWNISMFPRVNFAARTVTLTDHRLYGFVCWKI
jgi:hypothetical protein